MENKFMKQKFRRKCCTPQKNLLYCILSSVISQFRHSTESNNIEEGSQCHLDPEDHILVVNHKDDLNEFKLNIESEFREHGNI